ncbi:uncharacterized protein [Venturia canescens]|uniref:uncharacterized protein isoform X2 n=1 Tax=Venturia canescens TaxID=32260 RepID=UPI001C9C3499|nr:uncharacterized protein LOC122414064 isoform X2 [Venturia canescens]
MKWPLVFSWFVLQYSCIRGAPPPGCKFPSHWSGSWFQSGVQGMVVVNGTNISSKGQCMQADGEKFIILEQDCLRCIVMHEKHPNVLQYKETYCLKRDTNFDEACNKLTGDAVLYSLFRSGAAPSPCPIRGPLEFTYSIGSDGKECTSTSSFAEACTQDSRLLLRYLACPDVANTESTDVELECLATWKEGSTQYLVARRFFRKTERRLSNDEERYRCFVYAKTSNNTWNLAQSGDATCSALDSVTDGARTLRMTQKPVPERCSFPNWLVSPKSWIALDTMASTLLASTYNITILDRNETHLSCHKTFWLDEQQKLMGNRRENQVMIVAKATRGCDNGFVCLVLHKRDDPVIEMQISKTWTQVPEEACNSSKFNYFTAPYKTYITSDLTTRQCPYLGHYEVVYVMRSHVSEYAEENFIPDGEQRLSENDDNVAQVQEVRITSTTPFPRPCHHTSLPGLDIGCERSDRMKFATSCSDEALSGNIPKFTPAGFNELSNERSSFYIFFRVFIKHTIIILNSFTGRGF